MSLKLFKKSEILVSTLFVIKYILRLSLNALVTILLSLPLTSLTSSIVSSQTLTSLLHPYGTKHVGTSEF